MAPLNESHYAFMSNPHCLCWGKEPPFSPNVIFLFWKEENISDFHWTPQTWADSPLLTVFTQSLNPLEVSNTHQVFHYWHFAVSMLLLFNRAILKQHCLHLILDSVVTSSLTFYSLPSITFDSNCPVILSIVFKESNRPLGTESAFSKQGKNNKSLKIPSTWMQYLGCTS